MNEKHTSLSYYTRTVDNHRTFTEIFLFLFCFCGRTNVLPTLKTCINVMISYRKDRR